MLEKATEEQATTLEKEMKDQQVNSYKERIEALTEKFKNDPVKLAVLSKLAQEVAEV